MAQSVISIGNKVIVAETKVMVIPAGGAYARQVSFDLPLFADTPVVTATVQGDSPGNVFGIWNVTHAKVGNKRIVKISAANVERGVGVPFDYFCDMIAVGEMPIAKVSKSSAVASKSVKARSVKREIEKPTKAKR